MDTHIHDEFVIAAYANGQKLYTCRNEAGVMTRGDFLTISPGVPHSARSHQDEGCHYIAIYPTVRQFAEATDLNACEVERRLSAMRSIRSNDDGMRLCETLALLVEDGDDKSAEFAASVFLSDFAARFADCDDVAHMIPRSIAKVWDRLYEEPLAEVDLRDLAETAGISKEHLCRAFKAAFGISPFQLQRARRTAHARDLIRTGASLAAAAADAGFSDQSHMTRWFRRIYGAPPKAVARYQ